MATTNPPYQAALTSATFTPGISIDPGEVNISTWGTFNAIWHIQRSFDGNTWLDREYGLRQSHELNYTEPESCLYRVGCKPGNYSSGTIRVRIGQHTE